ncbi:MAG TPA: hypothetical protein VFP17_10030 [Solirubrobacterales bacterium]|nr:hypothetical protein [Solirubrobacterales bacterium]
MKHVKMLGLLVMAAASLMAFASSASAAPTLTSPAGTEYTGEIHAVLEGTALLKAGIEDTCTESTVKGTVTTNNETHAAGALSVLTFGNCTKPDTEVLKAGSLTIKDDEVFAIGNEVRIKDTILGITCIYGGGASPGTKIGTLDDSTVTGKTATLTVNTSELPRLPGSNETFCASKGTWTANYSITTPDSLFIT